MSCLTDIIIFAFKLIIRPTDYTEMGNSQPNVQTDPVKTMESVEQTIAAAKIREGKQLNDIRINEEKIKLAYSQGKHKNPDIQALIVTTRYMKDLYSKMISQRIELEKSVHSNQTISTVAELNRQEASLNIHTTRIIAANEQFADVLEDSRGDVSARLGELYNINQDDDDEANDEYVSSLVSSDMPIPPHTTPAVPVVSIPKTDSKQVKIVSKHKAIELFE